MNSALFDADEESLFEAACFFVPETSPLQKIRWLLTSISLQEAKQYWVEAAEALILCALTICDAIPHLKHVWRPSFFPLWYDTERSKCNADITGFSERFLEPETVLGTREKSSLASKLPRPTVPVMCSLLTRVAGDAVRFYLQEAGMDQLAYGRLESLLKALMAVIDDHTPHHFDRGSHRSILAASRKRYAEEEVALRRASASVSGDMTKLAERLLAIALDSSIPTGFYSIAPRPRRPAPARAGAAARCRSPGSRWACRPPSSGRWWGSCSSAWVR